MFEDPPICPICAGKEEERNHWEVVKRLRGNNRKAAIMVLVLRDGKKEDPENPEKLIVRCPFCHEILPEAMLKTNVNIHHLDEVPTHNHRFNLQLACHGCNSSVSQQHWRSTRQPSRATLPGRENNQQSDMAILETVKTSQPARSYLGERENELRAPRVGGERRRAEWSSAEGEKSEKMTALFESYIEDENGPFFVRNAEGKVEKVAVEFETLAIMASAYVREELPKLGESGCSSTTMKRYINDRSKGPRPSEPGVLHIYPDFGRKMVELVKTKFIKEEVENKTTKEEHKEEATAANQPLEPASPGSSSASAAKPSASLVLAEKFREISERHHTTRSEDQGVH